MTAAVACVLVSTALTPLFINSAVVRRRGRRGDHGRRDRDADPAAARCPVPACLAAGVAGLLLYLNLVFEARHSLLYVIPTPGSLARLWDLAGAGLHDANRYHRPCRTCPG